MCAQFDWESVRLTVKLMTTCVKNPSVEKRGSLVAFSRNFSGAESVKNKHTHDTHTH